MKKRTGLLDDGKSETQPLTQAELEKLRAETPHMTIDDLGEFGPKATDEFKATMAGYLHEFAKPVKGKMPCLRCGYDIIQDLVQQFLGARGGFTWGLVHGHGHCKECYWPIVMHHHIKDKDGKELLTMQFIPLQIHPSNLELPPKKEKDGKEN